MESRGKFTVNEDGSIDIPTSLLEEMGIDPDGPMFIEVVDEGIKIHRNKPKAYKKKKALRPTNEK
ncbi:MAG: hypothetical protein CVV00_03835 [Firmicutes bacterium HGW-Firmicutes-5]|nr:MAG: hypothetical protein CVV00_03835 [Firmicutes bacterium HGW-Firmicutes-5]